MSLTRTSVKRLCAASALLVAIVGVPLSRAAAAPPPPPACADIQGKDDDAGGQGRHWSAGLHDVRSDSGYLSSATYFEHVARLHVEMPFTVATCKDVTYEVTATSVDGKTQYRVATQQGDDVSMAMVFDAFIDRYTGYVDTKDLFGRNDACVIVAVRTFSGPKTYDVANDSNVDPAKVCKNGSGATNYGG